MENVSALHNVFEMAADRSELRRSKALLTGGEHAHFDSRIIEISQGIGELLIGKTVIVTDPSVEPNKYEDPSEKDAIQSYYPQNFMSKKSFPPGRMREHPETGKPYAPSMATNGWRLASIEGKVIGDDPEHNSIVIESQGKFRRIFGDSWVRYWVSLVDVHGDPLVEIEEVKTD